MRDPSSSVSLPARLGLGLIWIYQHSLSPVLYALGVRCRHEPSCSHYAAGAIQRQGLWRGSFLALGRVLRCRPMGTYGFDPVPEKRTDTPWWKIWALRSPPTRS